MVKLLLEKFVAKESLEGLIENDLKGLLTKILMQNDHGDIHLKRLQIALKNVQLLNQHGMKQDGKIFLAHTDSASGRVLYRRATRVAVPATGERVV